MQEVALTPAPSVATASAAAAAAAAAAPEPRRKQGARSFMVANAALHNWSTTQFAALLLLTVVTQLSWGLYGVCTRYLVRPVSWRYCCQLSTAGLPLAVCALMLTELPVPLPGGPFAAGAALTACLTLPLRPHPACHAASGDR